MDNFFQYTGWPINYQIPSNYVGDNSLMKSYCNAIAQLNAFKSKCERLQKQNYELQTQLKIKDDQNHLLRSKIEPSASRKKKNIKKRKRNVTQPNQHGCPYQNCQKTYASNLALNLHMKLKHNGGTKKQRQTMAKIVIQALQNGRQKPEINIQFPPNYLQNYRKYLSIKTALQK